MRLAVAAAVTPADEGGRLRGSGAPGATVASSRKPAAAVRASFCVR